MKSTWKVCGSAVVALASHAAVGQPCDSWTEFPATGAAPLVYTHGAAYDAARDRIVAFGGSNGCNLNTTWEYDGTNWTVRNPADRPGIRGDFPMVYDASRGRTVLFGGMTYSPCHTNSILGDHWEWDGDNWTQLAIPCPPARVMSGLAFDSLRSRVVLFGGAGPAGHLGDLWEFDGSQWSQVLAEGGPSPRNCHAMAYDNVSQKTVVVGGRNQSGFLSDVWTWDGIAWQQHPSIPELANLPNYALSLANDPATGRLILYAHNSDNVVKCFALADGGWTQLNIPLPPKQSGPLVSDTVRQRIVLFSGHTNVTLTTKMWEFKALPRPGFASHPQPQSLRVESALHLSATLSGPPASSVRWYRNGSPISNGGRISGANTTSLTILFAEPGDSGPYHLLANGTACSSTSNTAQVNVWCFADLDGGQENGVPNGAVDINDLLYFLSAFETGSFNADLDNGTSTGMPDNAVDINDLLFFLARFETGC